MICWSGNICKIPIAILMVGSALHHSSGSSCDPLEKLIVHPCGRTWEWNKYLNFQSLRICESTMFCRHDQWHFCYSYFQQKPYRTTPPSSSVMSVWTWKELPYDCNALKWSPAFSPTREHASGLSSWFLLIFHPVLWAHSILTDFASAK